MYAGAFVDVVYDHFLATDKNEFPENTLFEFSQRVYIIMDQYISGLPEKFRQLYPYMKSQNWLFHYNSRRGTKLSLGGVVRRAAYLTEGETAFRLFEEYYQPLQDCYRHFWADLKPFVRNQFETGEQPGHFSL